MIDRQVRRSNKIKTLPSTLSVQKEGLFVKEEIN
jgi:hypothetical protein